MSNSSFSAEPEVSGLTPLSGQSSPLQRSVRTDVHPHQFKGTAEGSMPSGSGNFHPSKSDNISARSAVGAESGQPQDSLGEDAEAAQAPEASLRPRVAFASVAQDPENEDEDDHDSIVDSQPVDKTYNRLVQYVYEKYEVASSS